jgi:hypothetical protein
MWLFENQPLTGPQRITKSPEGVDAQTQPCMPSGSAVKQTFPFITQVAPSKIVALGGAPASEE